MNARILLFSLLCLTVACGEPELETVNSDVGLFSGQLRVRADEFIQTDVYVPLGLDAPAPAVVFIQGGAVAAERYSWLGERLAENGYVSIHPHHATDLAFFSPGNAADALQTVRQLSETAGHPLARTVSRERASIIGHSLGGVVAAGAWLDCPDLFEHLVIFASFPAPAKDKSRDGEPTDRIVSIVGGEDPRVSVEEAIGGIEEIEATKTVAIAQGVSHYQFANDPQPEELENDGTPSVGIEVAHDRIFFLVDALLDDPKVLDDPTSWPEGVEAP